MGQRGTGEISPTDNFVISTSADEDATPEHKCCLRLPSGLVGTKCTARAVIANKEINCLLDTV